MGSVWVRYGFGMGSVWVRFGFGCPHMPAVRILCWNPNIPVYLSTPGGVLITNTHTLQNCQIRHRVHDSLARCVPGGGPPSAADVGASFARSNLGIPKAMNGFGHLAWAKAHPDLRELVGVTCGCDVCMCVSVDPDCKPKPKPKQKQKQKPKPKPKLKPKLKLKPKPTSNPSPNSTQTQSQAQA